MSGYVYHTSESMQGPLPFKIFSNTGKFKQEPHSHEYLQLWYVLRGSCTHVLNDHEYGYKRFGLFIVPPYAEHYLQTQSEDTTVICCEFSERFINEELAGNDRNILFDFAYLEPFFMHEKLSENLFQLKPDSRMQVENLMLELLKHFRNNNKYSMLFIKADLLKLLAIIASEYEETQSYDKVLLLDKYHTAIDSALAYLDLHFSEKLYLEDVCKISLMSQSSFSYIFKQVTGFTFTEYLMRLRISKAQELLKNSVLSAQEIAVSCGFGDCTYFSSAFRRTVGVSPTQYRKAIQSPKTED